MNRVINHQEVNWTISGEDSMSSEYISTVEQKSKLSVKKGFKITEVENTSYIEIPLDPLERVIGQKEAVNLARIAAMQHRNLLLVGPPGTGKSMIAQALALHLPHPKEELRVVHNPQYPERPVIEIKKQDEVYREHESTQFAHGELKKPEDVPKEVAEKLGYLCKFCGTYSSYRERQCPRCSKIKVTAQFGTQSSNPFQDLLGGIVEATISQITHGNERITTTRTHNGKDEIVVYERAGEEIRILDQKALEKKREFEKQSPRKVIVPLERSPFVLATGASETELLGDVRHDPYGGHPQLGSQPYERVIAGAIHEAHEGVLFIDELPHLGQLQRYILTAMQEKKFPISGRNPQSAGAIVKVDNVPCDFIFVGACNIQDIPQILSPLRSRIIGNGYEVLMDSYFYDNDINRMYITQFIAQEVAIDNRIPHVTAKGVLAIIKEAIRRAKILDGKDNALTLRLRELGGLIRTAGDIAVINRDPFIDEKHINAAIKIARPIEEQIKERYGTYQQAISHELSSSQKTSSPYYFWTQHKTDIDGYE